MNYRLLFALHKFSELMPGVARKSARVAYEQEAPNRNANRPNRRTHLLGAYSEQLRETERKLFPRIKLELYSYVRGMVLVLILY